MVASSVTEKPNGPFSACCVTKDKDDRLLPVLSNEEQLSDFVSKCSTAEPVVRRKRGRAPKLEDGENASKIRRKTISKTAQRRNPVATKIAGKRRKSAMLTTDVEHSKTTLKQRVRYTSIKKLIIPLIRVEDLPLSQLSQLILKPNYIEQIPGYPERKIRSSETTKSVTLTQHFSENKCKRKKMKNSQKIMKDVETFVDCKKIQRRSHLIQGDAFTKYQSPETDAHLDNVKLFSTGQCATERLKRTRKKKDASDGSVLNLYGRRRKSACGNRTVNRQSLQKVQLEETNSSIVPSIEHMFNNNYHVNRETTFGMPHVIHDEHIKEIEREMRELKLMTNGTSLENTCNGKMETFSESESNLDASQLSERVLKYFLEQKKVMASRNMEEKSKITNTKELPCRDDRVGKILAMCLKCNQVLHLLQQLRDKVNFINEETLSIECTLCNLHINSLYNLQQHLMDVHLQCDGKLSSTGEKFPAELVSSYGIISSKSIDAVAYECCCCPKACNDLVEFKEHMDKFHSPDIETYQIEEQITTNAESSVVSGIAEVTSSETSVLKENNVPSIAKNCDCEDRSNENAQIKEATGSHENVCTVKTNRADIKNRMNLSKSFIYFKDELEHEELSSGSFSDFNMYGRNALMDMIHIEKRSLSDSDIDYGGGSKPFLVDTKLKNIFSNRIYSKIKNMPTISANTEFMLPNPLNNRACRLPKKLFHRGAFPYICAICQKKFRRKNLLICHVKKHMTDLNHDMNQIQNGSIKVEISTDTHEPNGALLPNLCTSEEENPQNHENDTRSNSVGVNLNLGDATEKRSNLNIETGEINKEETAGSNCAIAKKPFPPNKNEMLTRHYARLFTNPLHRGKKEESTMLDVNGKIDEDVFQRDSRTNNNLALNQNQVNKCCICNQKFATQKCLMEHMIFVHDTNLDNGGLSTLTTPYLNETEATKNLLVQETRDSLQTVAEATSKLEASECFPSIDEMNDKKSCEYKEKNLNRVKGNKKWRCDLCKEDFALFRNYLRHKYYSHNDESVVHVCSNCNKVLTSLGTINVHTCTNVTSWSCGRCNLDFPNGAALAQHNTNDHYEDEGPHTCDVCSLTFLTRYMMDRHRSQYHVSNDQAIVNNVIRAPVITKITDLPPSLTASDTGNSENQITQSCDTDGNVDNLTSSKVHQLPERSENILKVCSTSNSINLSDESEGEEQLKCMLCNSTCLSKLQMKLHLAKQHNVRVDICRLCSNLYVTDSLANHLINRHIVLNDYNLNQNPKIADSNDATSTAAAEETEVDLVKILGFKRLLSLYEYQRFNEVPKNEHFNCPVCSNRFSNIQLYRRHYLEAHDMMCLLCNIQFKHTVQAMDHKVKSHISIDSYLWIVQKIIAAILQLDKNGNTIDDIILKFSETGSHNDEKYVSSKKQEDLIKNFDIEIPELLGLTDWNATIDESIQNNDLLLKIVETENASEIAGANDDDSTTTDPRYTSYNNRLPLINVPSCHIDNRNLYETCYSNSVDEPANDSTNEGQIVEDDKVSPVVVTEDALRPDQDGINTFVSESRSSSKIFSEEYLTNATNEGQIVEDDKVSPVVVTEDALRPDQDGINTFVSESRSSSKIFSEEYLTKLLTDPIENSEY